MLNKREVLILVSLVQIWANFGSTYSLWPGSNPECIPDAHTHILTSFQSQTGGCSEPVSMERKSA